MTKPTLEVAPVGEDMYEVRLYISSSITLVTFCNGNKLRILIEEYINAKD